MLLKTVNKISKFRKCPKIIYLYNHDDSLQCSICVCDDENKHESTKNLLPEATNELIRECVEDDIKNAKIIEKIREKLLSQS